MLCIFIFPPRWFSSCTFSYFFFFSKDVHIATCRYIRKRNFRKYSRRIRGREKRRKMITVIERRKKKNTVYKEPKENLAKTTTATGFYRARAFPLPTPGVTRDGGNSRTRGTQTYTQNVRMGGWVVGWTVWARAVAAALTLSEIKPLEGHGRRRTVRYTTSPCAERVYGRKRAYMCARACVYRLPRCQCFPCFSSTDAAVATIA